MILPLAAGLVTVSFAPLPLPEALAKLSSAMGKTLECAPALRDEVLVLRLKDADPVRVRQEIEKLFDARWETTGTRTVLLPDPKAIRLHAARRAAEADRTIENSLAYLKRRLAEQPATLRPADLKATALKKAREVERLKRAEEEEDYANMYTLSAADEETPGWRAAARLALLLGKGALAPLPNDSRFVWSSRPTPAQSALPPGAASVLADYRRELTLSKPEVEVARVRLVAHRWEHGGAFNVGLAALDEAGTVVDKTFLRMADDMDRMKGRSTVFDQPPALPGEDPLPLTADEREYLEVMDRNGDKDPAKALLMPKWRPILMDPTHHEPTRWLPASRLVRAAEALDRNLIGAPWEITETDSDAKEPQTASEFIAKTYGVTQRDGWIILDPDEPQVRAPRDAAARLIAACVRFGGAPLDLAAAWAGRTPGPFPFTNWVGQTITALLASPGGPYSVMSTLLDERGLRLWDALGAPARVALLDGKTLDLARLPSLAKGRIFRTVYWDENVEGEPTEVLPDGIEGGTVSLKTDREPIFVPSSSKDGTSAMAMTPELFGSYLAKGDSWREVKAERFLAYDRFRLGSLRTVHLNFLLGRQRVPMTLDLEEVRFDPAAPILDRLPDGLRQKVEAARVKALAKKPDPE